MIPFRDDIQARQYPVITVTIIVANALVYLFQSTLEPHALQALVWDFGLVPARLSAWRELPGLTAVSLLVTMQTSMFLHGGLAHLAGNMWFLWIFGDNVEDRMGPGRFLLFYLTCGQLAGVAHILFNLESAVPAIGASGALAGVLGAYFVSFPFARVLVMIPPFFLGPFLQLPAMIVLGIWFLLQFAGVFDTSAGGGVAWWAHVGGFIAGASLIGFFAKPSPQRYYWRIENGEDGPGPES